LGKVSTELKQAFSKLLKVSTELKQAFSKLLKVSTELKQAFSKLLKVPTELCLANQNGKDVACNVSTDLFCGKKNVTFAKSTSSQ
jgi:hypothetical protein